MVGRGLGINNKKRRAHIFRSVYGLRRWLDNQKITFSDQRPTFTWFTKQRNASWLSVWWFLNSKKCQQKFWTFLQMSGSSKKFQKCHLLHLHSTEFLRPRHKISRKQAKLKSRLKYVTFILCYAAHTDAFPVKYVQIENVAFSLYFSKTKRYCCVFTLCSFCWVTFTF